MEFNTIPQELQTAYSAMILAQHAYVRALVAGATFAQLEHLRDAHEQAESNVVHALTMVLTGDRPLPMTEAEINEMIAARSAE